MMKAETVALTCIAAMLAFDGGAFAVEWQTDYAQAASNAVKTGRYMLLDFSGSDWCGWCMKLDKEVFTKPEFNEFAAENLVCVLLDFPRRKQQSQKEKEQNQTLAKKYGINGFPTVILLAPGGELVGQTGYQPGGAEKYVRHLAAMIREYEKLHPRKQPEQSPAPVKPDAPGQDTQQ